jgi:SAM-dependent methyltransferase
MQIDQDRIRAVILGKHSYYAGSDIPICKDTRWGPGLWDLIAQELSPEARVLDVGCGASTLLLDLSKSFHTGIGVDVDEEALQIAEEAKQAQGITNVEYLRLDFPREIARFQRESFDMVISLRGPIGDTDLQVQAAHHLLRPNGLIFSEEIAELHENEVDVIFDPEYHRREIKPRVNEVKMMLERNGFEVRLAADRFTKWIYPDLYAWLQYQCNLWTWLHVPLPEPDDPRIALFAERNTNAKEEIEITHHVAWLAGVKK